MISKNQLKLLRSLQQKKYRKQEKKFLIEGLNLCRAAIESYYRTELFLFGESVAEKEPFAALQQLASGKGIDLEIIADKTIMQLSDAVSPQGVVAVVKMPELKLTELWDSSPHQLIILDKIADPGNLGTIIRSAAWFGLSAVICSDRCVDLYNAKVLRSSAGSVFYIPQIYTDVEILSLSAELAARGYQLYAADSSGKTSYREADFSVPYALIVGSERHGVQAAFNQLPVQKISIPRHGKGDSLNAGVAASIILTYAVGHGS
ncbi:MAG TPA: RNA methyltransferase [Bacteroidetes bacterium]|nr:RNA methyltransferase [Bacteroidota bacterium]